MESLGIGIAAVDPDGRQSYVNSAFARMVGWSVDQLVGAVPPFVYWPPEQQERIREAFQQTLRGEAPPGGFELRFQRRDGSRFDALVSVSEFPGAEGSNWVAAVVDISELKRTQDQLRAQAALLDAVGEAAIVTDLEGRVTFWNREAERLYGWKREEVLGRSILEVTVPETSVEEAQRIMSSVLAGRSWTGEYVVRGSGGRRFPVLLTDSPVFDNEGRVIGIIGVSRDISDRKAAEEARGEETRVAETLHAVGRSLASELDLERIVQAVTDAGTALTGAQFGAFFYNVLSEKGESYTLYTISGVPREAFSHFPMPRNTPIFAPTFYGEGVVRSADITRDPRYGQVPPHHGMPPGHLPVRSYLAVPVVSRTGEVLGGLFFGHEDVGVFEERHERLAVGIASWAAVAMDNARLYEAEQRARASAEAASRAKSDFLAVMSHELRTPLNAMIGYADLLLAGVPEPIPDHARQKVERIGLSAQHLLELIEEILTFSRLEAGEERVDARPLDPLEVVGEVCALMEPIALVKGIEFDCHAPDQPPTLESDPRKIRQILLNLLSNAIKFTEEGKVELELAAVGDEIVFRVSDTGVGIAPGDREQIFEPFWQVQRGVTRTAGGTGLGLSVTRRLARLLGGEVTVEERAEGGSVFTVRLPLHAPRVPEPGE